MKSQKIIYALLLFVILCSCGIQEQINPSQNKKGEYSEFYTFEYDSCEYVGNINSKVLTHKGNCKFCVERNKINNH